MVKIEDVAKLAGVSIATVSRVINGSYRIATPKYERVLKAIEELDYKSPRKQIENNQVLIINSMINEEFTCCLEESAGKYNFSTLHKYLPEAEISIENLPEKSDFAGIIILDALATEETYEKLRKQCPVVLCRVQYDYANTISVSVDDEQVAYDVTSSLLNQGRKRVAMVCDIDRSFSSGTTNQMHLADRKRLLNGYFLAHLDNNIPVDDDLIFATDDFVKSQAVEDKFREYLSNSEKCPDAVFSSSIPLALTLSNIAEEFGKQVPEEIIFGTCGAMFRNLKLPNMIYAGQPIERLVDVTFQTLNSIIKGELPADKQHHIYIEHTLINY